MPDEINVYKTLVFHRKVNLDPTNDVNFYAEQDIGVNIVET